MCKCNPDVFAPEEKIQDKNPECYKQYVEEDANDAGKIAGETPQAASPVMPAKGSDQAPLGAYGRDGKRDDARVDARR